MTKFREWSSRTISHKLLLAFFLVFFGTYLATALVVLTAVRSSIVESEHETLEQSAHYKLNNLNTRFEQLATNLHAWSKLDVMNDLASGDVDQRIARALADMKTNYALKGNLFAFNAKGILLATSNGARPQGVSLPAIWRPHGRLSFVDKHASPLTGHEIVALTTPVYSSFAKNFRFGTLVMTYPWSAVRQAVAGNAMLLRRAKPPVILDFTLDGVNKWRVVQALEKASPGSAWLRVAGRRYLYHLASNDGDRFLADWAVVVFKTPAGLDHALMTVAWQLAALCALLSLPLVAMIRWLSHRLTAPLRELTRFVAGIDRADDLSQRLQPSSKDEIGTLTTAFNHMTERLEAGAQELERKVEARTHELSAANEDLSRVLNELQSAHSQLVQQEKMASLGQLVAGVAHELNNPIGFLYANCPHLEEYTRTLLDLVDGLQRLPLSEEAKDELERRLKAADIDYLREDLLKIIRSGESGARRVKEIVSSLRSFSRLDEAVEKMARLEDGIDDTLALLHHQLRQRIEVIRDYRLNSEILCHPGQLNQVFMNILHNAIQAMPDTGTITVSTRREGDWALVAISDTGSGIPPESLGRIFDPFYTSKTVGEGTGLGLSISYGIVQNHGGRIEVESVVGQGTTFTIFLPIR